jgi:hypothetical protein
MCVPVRRLRAKATLQQVSCLVVCALVVASTVAISIGCGRSGAESNSEINLVRNGFLKVRAGDGSVKTYDSAIIGTALERKFTNGTWRQFTAPEGVVVEFDATVLPATLYKKGFSVWSPFLKKESAVNFGVPDEKGSVSLRAATTCISDSQKRVAVAQNGGRIVIDCRLLFQMQFTVSANGRNFDLRYISLATFDTDDQGKVFGYIYG